ncbi:MAG: M20/M25/M40 family metallo-hydrolase, partial [Chloroflexi bacterium]|nr:M20/M25/M40 family metallo-hydrolase [Chloroflexota bacterium]
MEALIKTLAEAWGPPGFEHRVRDLIRAEVEPLADELRVDPLGNLICRVGNGPKRVMLAAHMDEIGLMISHIDRQGFARFAPMGTLFPATLLGARVRFENGVIGSIGVEHQYSKRRELPETGGFYIDIEQDSAGQRQVNVGDPGAFAGEVVWRGERVIGKSLDDRLGCAVLIEALRRVKQSGTPHSVYGVFTVQEEVGSRGAGPAAYGLDPHLGIALDVTSTSDVPHGRSGQVKLGAGPVILARDGGVIAPPKVRDLMIRAAESAGLTYQVQVIEGVATDGREMQIARAGVPTGTLSIP